MNEFTYIEEMKKIQEVILNFLEDGDDNEEFFQNMQLLFDDFQIHDDIHKIKLIFYLILQISNSHNRSSHFFNKIDQILQLFKEDIKKYFSNMEIFKIFGSNKRILLFLIEEKLLIIDKYIVQIIIKESKYTIGKYPQYFRPEIEPFINENWFPKQSKNYLIKMWIDDIKKEYLENFYENRKKGENENSICELIRNDSIEEFIVYVNQYNISLNGKVEDSIYETHSFLIQDEPTLIEYASFFGSYQIFNYLRLNGAQITSSLWFYAIHGNDPQIIEILKEDVVVAGDNTHYIDFFVQAIKCHHNDLANYFHDNYLNNLNENENLKIIEKCISYYNFAFMPKNFDYSKMFFAFCKYDYYDIVKELTKNNDLDVNQKKIFDSIIS